MNKKDRKKLRLEIIISSTIILLVSTIVVLIEHCYPNIIIIQNSTTKNSILSDILKAVGLFLGFVITSIVMRFNQLDGLIQKLAEDLNTILNEDSKYRCVTLTQKELTAKMEARVLKNKDDNERRILINYTAVCRFRANHLKWLMYPLYYSLSTLCFAFFLLIFHDTINRVDYIYSFSFMLCCLMAVWTVKINIDLVYSFFTNSFIKDSD